MNHELSLSPCGQYLSIELGDRWEMNVLKVMSYQAHSRKKIDKSSRIIINAQNWLQQTLSMESILSMGEHLSKLSENDWKIAVVTPDLCEHNSILENVLNIKGIEMQHFDSKKNAEAWLMQV